MITGIIMASGFSTRMNRNKLVLDFGGMPIIERVIRSIKASKVDNIIMVYREDRVKEIGTANGIKTVYNNKADLGQSQSIKVGIENAPLETKGFMFFVADQPFLNSYIIDELIGVFKEGKHQIIVPEYNGKRSNPVIFSSELKDELLNLDGDEGGRSIIRKMPEKVRITAFENSIIGKDIDTWEEYIKWR